ncbi:MAG: hypothetical protein H7Y36_04710 [Armatimonadetes bacterium]|nr:hypothetical protein [Akkermansiaceae bacterium]
MTKSDLMELIRADLGARLERLSKAAMAAHAAATDPGSKAESKYDTRSLEESYLASGQARQVRELAETLAIFEHLRFPDFEKTAEIDAGALVEVEKVGAVEKVFFLLAPASGGLEISHSGRLITLLSPDSPLYRQLLGLKIGDALNQPAIIIRGVE